MGLKWTVFFLLYFTIAGECMPNSFKVAGGRVPPGHVDINENAKPFLLKSTSNKEKEPATSHESEMRPAPPRAPLRRIVVDKKESEEMKKSSEEHESHEHVEHPVPPSGPMSRIVLTSLDDFRKPKPSENNRDLKASTSDNLESRHPYNKEYDSDDDDSDNDDEIIDERSAVSGELPLYRLKPVPMEEGKEDKDGLVYALHHKITGDRKEYFKRTVSKMTKEELEDLQHALLAALEPKPDDDVQVDEVKVEFKEVVHELAEKQEVTVEKKEALIEIEHVLEEKRPDETVPAKQVIKMGDWKKQGMVGRIFTMKDSEDVIVMSTTTQIPVKDYNDDLQRKEVEPSTNDEMKDGFVDKFVTKEEKSDSEENPGPLPVPRAGLRGDYLGRIQSNERGYKKVLRRTMPPSKEEMNEDRTQPGAESRPVSLSMPVPRVNEKGMIKEVIIEKIPETVDERKTDGYPKSAEESDMKEGRRGNLKLRVNKGTIMSGILSKRADDVMRDRKEDDSSESAEENVADSITQPDENMEERVRAVGVGLKRVGMPVKREDSDSSSDGSSEEESSAAPSQVEEKLVPRMMCGAYPMPPMLDKKGVVGNIQNSKRESGSNGWGSRESPKSKRVKRHSRIYYRRTPYKLNQSNANSRATAN